MAFFDGQLDADFGSAGVSITDFGWDDWAASLALQWNGMTVVAGSVGPYRGSGTDFAMARFQSGTPRFSPKIWLPIIVKKNWR